MPFRKIYKGVSPLLIMVGKCIRCGEKGFVYLGWKSDKKTGKAIRDKQVFCMMCKPMGWRRANKK